ncbi:hypothetical protein ACHAXN_012773 [Cyclotella atomus]
MLSHNNRSTNMSEKELKIKRLSEIRDAYKRHMMTPQEKKAENDKEMNDFWGDNAKFQADFKRMNDLLSDMPDEDSRDNIVTTNFLYNDGTSVRNVTITSEGSRHWREATV